MNELDLDIICESIIASYFCSYFEELSEPELKHINNFINYELVPDRLIADNSYIHKHIEWDRISKMKAIRLVSRNLDLIQYIDLKKYDFIIREMFWFIKSDYTKLFKYFNFDFSKSTHEDNYLLLCLGVEYFEKTIPIESFNFSFIEIMDIIKAYKYKREITLRLKHDLLKSYQVTEILSMTGEENLDLFNLEILSTLNWIELLNYQPEFIERCDFDKFKKGDLFNLVQLVILFEDPDLSYLIFEINNSDISPFGLEKLLICNPEKFIDICDFSKLNEDNWNRILTERPELVAYKL